jgi:predicted phosphatase
MKARESLINKYLEIIKGGGVFLYCDTDSIVYIDKKDIKFNDIGKELGC